MRVKLIVLASVVLAACGKEQPKETIKLGSVLGATGLGASAGTSQLEGITLAVEQINAAGGVLGKNLELVSKDDQTVAATAVQVAGELADLGVPAIFGASPSSLTLAVAQNVTSSRSIVQVSAASTSPLLTNLADNGFLFRTAPSDALQGKLLAQRARAKSFTKVAVIHVPGAYGSGLAEAFVTAFTGAGGTVTDKIEYVENQTSYATVLATVYAKNPEAIVLAGYPIDSSQIIKDYLAGYAGKNTFFFFADSLNDGDFLNGVGPSKFTFSHEGTTAGLPTTPAYDAFVTAFKARFSKDPAPYTANAYDAVQVVALAMQAAGKAEGTAIRDQMAAVSTGGKNYTASQIKEALADAAAGKDIDYSGASGNIDFDSHGDVTGPYDLWKVEAGAFTITQRQVNP